jgi:hypothetical protein
MLVKLRKFLGVLAIVAGLCIAGQALYGAATQLTELVGDINIRSSGANFFLDGAVTFKDLSGNTLAAFNTAQGGFGSRRTAYVTAATTQTLTAADCGAVIVANHTTATQTFTLPAVTNTGCFFTFIAGNAATEILINAAAVSTCIFTFATVGTVSATVTDTSCETGIKNTAATNVVGDTITLLSDGVRWFGVGTATGTWAVQ